MSGGYKGFWAAKSREASRPSDNRLSYIESADRVISVKQKDDYTGISSWTDIRLAVVVPLKPGQSAIPGKDKVKIYSELLAPGVVRSALRGLSGILAVDIETKGTQAAAGDSVIVGVGIASVDKILYFDFSRNSELANQAVLTFLTEYNQGLVGHNVFFDGAYLYRDTGVWLDWRFDTYALYKHLANEGHPGQRYGLKQAQIDLLSWDEKGDKELDEWLTVNHLIKSAFRKEASDEELLEKLEKGSLHVLKGEMYQAPAAILGYYCGLDAFSTLELLLKVFLPSIEGQIFEPEYLEYHALFIQNVQKLAEQQLSGITIDKSALELYQIALAEKVKTADKEFLEHPLAVEHVRDFNEQMVQEVIAKEPPKFKALPKLGEAPAQYKKDGSISKTYLKWEEKRLAVEALGEGEIAKSWENWEVRVKEAREKNHFNTQSGVQLAWLFYDRLNYPVLVYTDSGTASTGVKSLPGFGELGAVLKRHKDQVKELGYVGACLEHLYEDVNGDFRLHPQFRAPGTLTGRLAGSGGLNLQQIPKSRPYLECWRPVQGKAWVDCDHSSLEQVVMAELSRDPALYKIYGPNATPGNDIYLFNGSQLPIIGDKIRAAGYDPDNFTEETVNYAKKICKKERQIAKVITLGSSYGMGAEKMLMTLKLQGVDISKADAYDMHAAYWKLYAGVKTYEKELLREHKRNNGWVLNGIGRPVCVGDAFTKDIVNRVVQSTGHDIHMMYIEVVTRLFAEHNLDVKGIVWDFHDQSIVECEEGQQDLVKHLLGVEAYEILNKQYLQGDINLKGDAQLIRDLADAKVPE